MHLKTFINKGKTCNLDIQKILDEKFAQPYGDYGSGNKKTRNVNAWSQQNFFVPVKDQAEADVIISGTYNYNKETVVEEKILKEKSNNFASRIPYSETRTTNKVELSVIINFKYKDNSSTTDTINLSYNSEGGKANIFESPDELEQKCIKSFRSNITKYFKIIKCDDLWYKFTKIKIKDKALKEEFKNARELLDTKKVKELGALYKKIYNLKKTKEVAHCIGMCYELLGNYPKAQEYYKQMPDFATKVRMKNQLKVFKYLQELNMTLKLEEF